MGRWNFKYSLLACLIAIFAASLACGAAGFSLISVDQLKQELTKPGIIVIDVRTGHDWASSQWKIQGAQRQDPAAVKKWMGKFPKDETIVLYCA